MNIKNPKEKDLVLIDKLASNIFMPETSDESMAAWFDCLLGKSNLKHINCVYKNDVPVAMVNWYSSNIKSESSVITVGSIGAVCCDEKERGKGYADVLLKHSFYQMEKEGIALCLISGTRGLYIRNGAVITGKEYKFKFFEREFSKDVKHIDADKMHDYADVVYRFHSERNNRFIRSFEHTENLLKCFGNSHHNCVCELYYTENGYVIADINKKDLSADSYIVEYGGKDVLKIFKHICYSTNRKLKGEIEYYDEEMLKRITDKEMCNLDGSVKIINIKLLFKQLNYKFKEAGINNIEITENDNEYEILYDGKKYCIDRENLYTLLFQYADKKLFACNQMPTEFEKVFPIQIPKIDGMDFI